MDDKAPTPVRISIRSLYARIITTFSQLSTALGSASVTVTAQLSKEALDDQLGYFRLWAKNNGAHRKGRVSLDHKLRFASHVHDKVTRYLTELDQALHTVIEIVKNDGVVRPYSPSSCSSSSSEEALADSNETFEENLPNTTPLEYAFQEVEVRIKCLMRLSVVLRQPAPRDYQAKLALPENKMDYFEPYDIGHVESKVAQFACRVCPPMSTAEEQENAPKFEAPTFLIKRLGKANTRRRQLFRYLKRHHEKIAEYIDAPSASRQEDHAEVKPLEAPILVQQAPSTLDISMKSQTTVTTVHQISRPIDNLEMEVMSEDGQTNTSIGTTVSLGDGYESKMDIPDPPKSAEPLGDRPFQCPFCHYIINPSNDRAWKRHVLRDLKPYVCTFEYCPSSTHLFESRHEWSSHENQFHRREWFCPPCKFTSRNRGDFEVHLRNTHPEQPPLESIIARYERPIFSEENCNLCGKLCYPGQLMVHLGRHMQQIAMFVLPKDLEDAEEEGSNDGSATASANFSSSLQMSSVSDFGSPQKHSNVDSSTQHSFDDHPADPGTGDEREDQEISDVDVNSEILSEDDVDTLASIAKLASEYENRGQWEEAKEVKGKIKEMTRNGSALQAAASKGNEAVVRVLIENGADVNAKGEEYRTALRAAAFNGHEAVARLFIDSGADVNVDGEEYGTALWAAAFKGKETVVRLLIDRGADVNADGGEYGTALQAVALNGHEAVARLLIDSGADVSAQSGSYNNALQAAAFNGNEAVVRLLIDGGADVNTQSGYHGTALQVAASKGDEALVRLLIENGADVNAEGGEYGNALQAAASKGHEAVVQLLIQHGAIE